jgi:hypothetical protein
MKRGVNPAYSTKNGDLTVRQTTPEELRFKRRPGQSYPNLRTKSSRSIGDKIPVFGSLPKKPTYQGGEGGNGWSIPATLC